MINHQEHPAALLALALDRDLDRTGGRGAARLPRHGERLPAHARGHGLGRHRRRPARRLAGRDQQRGAPRARCASLEEAPGIARGPDGKPFASPELYLIVDGVKRASGTKANLPLRGIGPEGAAIREDITLIEGRMFNPGSNELVVGKGDTAANSRVRARQHGRFRRLDALDRGRRVRCRRQRVRIGNLGRPPVVQSLFKRLNSFQTHARAAGEPGGARGARRATSRTIRGSSSTPNRRLRTSPTRPRSPPI